MKNKSLLSEKIGVVIVTYNRLEKLKKALEAYENQKMKPSVIIVVDNNSTDGTKDYLKNWQNESFMCRKNVIFLDNNIGGSGGFSVGVKEAISEDCEWIWVADDDAFPEFDAIEIADNEIKKLEDDHSENVVAICGAVINNGAIDLAHRRMIKNNFLSIKEENIDKSMYNKASFYLNAFSYVGSIISKAAINKVGLIDRNYFIYYDDTEHSYRLSLVGKIKCFPSIKIMHDQDTSNGDNTVSWKYYYGHRNKFHFYKKYFPLTYAFIYTRKMISLNMEKILNSRLVETKIILEALKDSKNNKLGMHNIYKPGWSAKKS